MFFLYNVDSHCVTVNSFSLKSKLDRICRKFYRKTKIKTESAVKDSEEMKSHLVK